MQFYVRNITILDVMLFPCEKSMARGTRLTRYTTSCTRQKERAMNVTKKEGLEVITPFARSLVPSPTPSFSSLLSTVLSSDEKLGVGLGTRLLCTCVRKRVHVKG